MHRRSDVAIWQFVEGNVDYSLWNTKGAFHSTATEEKRSGFLPTDDGNFALNWIKHLKRRVKEATNQLQTEW